MNNCQIFAISNRQEKPRKKTENHGNLLQIHHEDGHGDDTFGRLCVSGFGFAQTTLQLCQAENSAFHTMGMVIKHVLLLSKRDRTVTALFSNFGLMFFPPSSRMLMNFRFFSKYCSCLRIPLRISLDVFLFFLTMFR